MLKGILKFFIFIVIIFSLVALANVLGVRPKDMGEGVVKFAREFRQPLNAIVRFTKVTLPVWGQKINHTVITVKREMREPVAKNKPAKNSQPAPKNAPPKHDVSEKDREQLREILPEK